MSRSKGRKPKGARGSIPVAEFAVDPLLVGADREFVGSFKPGVLVECGVVPLRRYRDVGLVVPRSGPLGRRGLEKAQKASRVRLVAVPAIHDYGVDLFLRYLESGDENGPPLWLPESRRSYLARLGDYRAPQTAPLIAALILTSPLAASCPILVAATGGRGHALYLHGTAGLKEGLRFPGGQLEGVLSRLKLEFGMDGMKPPESWIEGRGLEERGLDDLTALLLPPLQGNVFVIEPKGSRR